MKVTRIIKQSHLRGVQLLHGPAGTPPKVTNRSVVDHRNNSADRLKVISRTLSPDALGTLPTTLTEWLEKVAACPSFASDFVNKKKKKKRKHAGFANYFLFKTLFFSVKKKELETDEEQRN